MSKIKTHDDYIAQSAESMRPALKKLRNQLRKFLPEADEVIAYNMPGFSINGSIIVGYAAFTNQCGIYLNPDAIALYSDEIVEAGFKPTKTGVKFSPSKPLPEELVKNLAQALQKSLGLYVDG